MVAAVAAAVVLSCRPQPGIGTAVYQRGRTQHVLDLSTCRESVETRPRVPPASPFQAPDGTVATIRATGHGRTAKQTLWAGSRPVFTETEYYKAIGPGDTPGPIELLGWSGDSRWIFFTIDPGGSGSIAADGLILRVVSARGGRVHKLGSMLAYPDYLAWCGGRLVWSGGAGRLATSDKRLLAAAPPSWRPAPVVRDPGVAWGSVICAPGGRSVVVQSQPASDDASFFHTRWSLWQVGLDGTRRRLTAPPAHFADDSPRYSGGSLLFVRSRNGYGTLYALQAGSVVGPFAALGYDTGYYGHHDWAYAVRR